MQFTVKYFINVPTGHNNVFKITVLFGFLYKKVQVTINKISVFRYYQSKIITTSHGTARQPPSTDTSFFNLITLIFVPTCITSVHALMPLNSNKVITIYENLCIVINI